MGPGWTQAWASHGPMMGPSLGAHGPTKSSKSNKQTNKNNQTQILHVIISLHSTLCDMYIYIHTNIYIYIYIYKRYIERERDRKIERERGTERGKE
jgi:hypothetical protein